MNKPVIRWKPVSQEDPADRSRTLWVPVITERNTTKTLSEVVFAAIDRGLIAGLKTSAAQGIAEGILTQLGEELNSAHGVLFGDYFAVRAYLSGTVAGPFANLTSDNRLNTRFAAGAALRLDRGNFSFRNVLATGDLPVIDETQGEYDGAIVGEFKAGYGVQLIGSNLKLKGGDKVRMFLVDGQGEQVVKDFDALSMFTQNSDRVLTIGAAALPDVLTDRRYGFKVLKTVTVEGVSTVVESEEAYANCIEGVTPGPTPIAQTSDGKCKVMTFKDGESATEFTLGNAWALAGSGLYDMSAPQGEWEYDGAKVTVDGTEVVFAISFSGDGASGTVASHTGTPAPGTYENVAMSYSVVNGDTGESETLTIPIPRLVVAE